LSIALMIAAETFFLWALESKSRSSLLFDM
jgi:hypothetical protein